MRTRVIVKNMADGDPEAFELAEHKLSLPNVHEDNKVALREALAIYKDPRKETTA